MKILSLHKNQRICFDENFVNDPLDQMFLPEYWQQQDRVLGKAQGRGTTWFVQMVNGNAALRHYRRGGLLGKWIKDSYFFIGWNRCRSLAEFQLLTELRQADVNVPRPIAAQAMRKGLFYQADILVELISDAQDLSHLLTSCALNAQHYQQIGAAIATMHKAQVNHTDLNIHNILLDKDNKVWLIDFDKCKKQSGNNWQRHNLERLFRSFKKEKTKANIIWNKAEFVHVLNGYNDVSDIKINEIHD